MKAAPSELSTSHRKDPFPPRLYAVGARLSMMVSSCGGAVSVGSDLWRRRPRTTFDDVKPASTLSSGR